MGNNRTEQRQQYMEEIPYDFLQHVIDISVQHSKNVERDVLGYGVIFGGVVSPTSPASISVTISAMLGYSRLGDHLKSVVSTTVDCSKDYNNESTRPTTGQFKWISIFAFPLWTEGDERPNGIGNITPHNRTEDVEFKVYPGSATALPLYPGYGAIRVCSIRLASDPFIITAGMISTGENQKDSMAILTDYFKKSGDDLTGSTTYNKFPLLYSNSGTHSFTYATQLGDVGNEDWNSHWICSTSPIYTGITGHRIFTLITPLLGLYVPGNIVSIFANPIQMRWQTDLQNVGTTLSEGIYVYQETDGNGIFTGKIQIIVLGSQHFVTRFAGHIVHWMVIAPIPYQASL